MADENPIMNNPYGEAEWHYSTNLAGKLDYSKPVKGRRVFVPMVQKTPVRQGAQAHLIGRDELPCSPAASSGRRRRRWWRLSGV